MRQRQAESAAAQRERSQQLWGGFEVGDVVILGPELSKASYGLHLCNDHGDTVLMDGVLMDGELMAIEADFARVWINRSHGKRAKAKSLECF